MKRQAQRRGGGRGRWRECSRPTKTSCALLMLRRTMPSHERGCASCRRESSSRHAKCSCVESYGEESSPHYAAGESEMERREREKGRLSAVVPLCAPGHRPVLSPAIPLLDMAPKRFWLMRPAPRHRRSLRPGEQQAVRIVCISGSLASHGTARPRLLVPSIADVSRVPAAPNSFIDAVQTLIPSISALASIRAPPCRYALTFYPRRCPVQLTTYGQPRCSLIVVLFLQRGADGRFYIKRQEDYYDPTVYVVVPPPPLALPSPSG